MTELELRALAEMVADVLVERGIVGEPAVVDELVAHLDSLRRAGRPTSPDAKKALLTGPFGGVRSSRLGVCRGFVG